MRSYIVTYKGVYQGTYNAASAAHAKFQWCIDYGTDLQTARDVFGASPVAIPV